MSDRGAAQAAAISAALVVGLVVFEWVVIGLPFGRYFVELWKLHSIVGTLPRIAAAVAIAIVQGLFFWASLRSSAGWRVVYLTLFTVAVFTEYGYVRAAGRVTTAVDILVAWDSRQLWSTVGPASVDWKAAIPILAYAIVLFRRATPRAGHHLRGFAAVVVVTWLAHSSYVIAGYVRRDRDVSAAQFPAAMVTAQAFWRSLTFAGWNGIETLAHYYTREQLQYRSTAQPTRHVVFIVDESVRGDHLSVNGYSRRTTPILEDMARQGQLTTWGVASSSTPISVFSVSGLLTGVRNLPDVERRTLSWPTIFQYAKAMNYRTHLFDAEDFFERFPLTPKDFRFIDDWKAAKEFGAGAEADFNLASSIAALLREPAGQFIVAFKQGNHYPYSMNVPPEAAKWPSKAASAEADRSRDAYDSALFYNVNGFFTRLTADRGSLERAAILYTSDHADALTYTGTGWRAFSRETFSVPMIMIGAGRQSASGGYLASHDNVFATLLDLLEFPEGRRSIAYGRSLLKASPNDHDPRIAFTGDLFAREAYQSADFDALPSSEIGSRAPGGR